MAVPFEECLKRNKTRDRKVPEHKMKEMYMTFSPVGYHEGWDEIKFVSSDKENEVMNSLELVIKSKTFNQNNTHHNQTLGKHLKNTAYQFKDNKDDMNLFFAAVFHDIGKMFTESKDKQGISHYYNHENVSSYIAGVTFASMIDNNFTEKDVVYIQNLIYLHMRPFDWVYSDKAYNKAIETYGIKMINDVMKLHDADVEHK